MSYVIRIELSSNIMADFDVLHLAMKNKGFSRTIRASDNKDYYLPRATYYTTSSQSRSSILEIAKQAVAQTGKSGEILVVESAGCSWSGLHEVKG